MHKKLSLFCTVTDRSHVLIILNTKKALSGVANVALVVKIILMKVTQFPTYTCFSRDNDFNTSATSSKLMGSHSDNVGSSWSSEVSELATYSPLKCLSSTFNSSVTSCLPAAFKNNCSAWGSSLNVVWSNLSLMALTIESKSS